MKGILFNYGIEKLSRLWLDNGESFMVGSNFPNKAGLYEIESYTHVPGYRPAFKGIKFIGELAANKDFLYVASNLGLKHGDIKGYFVDGAKNMVSIDTINGEIRSEHYDVPPTPGSSRRFSVTELRFSHNGKEVFTDTLNMFSEVESYFSFEL